MACVCCKYTSDVYIPFYFAFSCVLFVFAYSQLCSSHCYSINSKSYSAFSRSFRFVLIVKLPHSDTHLNNVRRKSKILRKKNTRFCKSIVFLDRPNASGSSTPTHSSHEGTFDGLESDQLAENRLNKGSLPSTSKNIPYDANQNNDFPSAQNRSIRNPASVTQRLSSLMAIKNNVS